MAQTAKNEDILESRVSELGGVKCFVLVNENNKLLDK